MPTYVDNPNAVPAPAAPMAPPRRVSPATPRGSKGWTSYFLWAVLVGAALVVIVVFLRSNPDLAHALTHMMAIEPASLPKDLEKLIVALAFTTLATYPVANYLRVSWARKREEILTSLSPSDKRQYLNMFWKGADPAGSDAEQRFQHIYDRSYGRHRYTMPLLFLIVAAFADSLILASDLWTLIGSDKPILTATAGAVTGAYAYVTYDLILRQQRRDLATSDVLRGALRLAIGVPLGIAFGTLIDSNNAAFYAFAVGVFPLDTIALILRRLVNQKLKLEIGADSADDQVKALSGIDAQTADRIQQADITTIAQLAWCDPVQLSMRSNLSFAYVLDIVSQALASVYLGKKLPMLVPLGLRGAVEIRYLFMSYCDGSDAEKKSRNAVISQAAVVSGIDEAGLMNAFEQIANDEATIFLSTTLCNPNKKPA